MGTAKMGAIPMATAGRRADDRVDRPPATEETR
jgi:hypothetical protein